MTPPGIDANISTDLIVKLLCSRNPRQTDFVIQTENIEITSQDRNINVINDFIIFNVLFFKFLSLINPSPLFQKVTYRKGGNFS